MTMVQDLARLIETFCNDEGVGQEKGGSLVAHGMYLDHDMFAVLTPTCSLLEREQVLAELPMWAQRQINQSAAEANAVTNRIVDITRRRHRATA